jgi:hypothetical protein
LVADAPAAAGAGQADWGREPPIVHRRPPAAPDLEEILNRREKRFVSETARRDEETTRTSVTTSETWTRNDLTRSDKDAASRSAEDIADMINDTLMRRIGLITDSVYGQLEKRLRSEKSRRGGM